MTERVRIGGQTVVLPRRPGILGWGSTAGKKEGEGPLRRSFGQLYPKADMGQKTWEAAEQALQSTAFRLALEAAVLKPDALQGVFGGDLLNQCTTTSSALESDDVPFYGLYGACSTMAEGLALAAQLCDGGYADPVAAITSSHFCTSERQFRNPLEYGSQRTPTAQRTVTGAGCVILGCSAPADIHVTHVTTGKILDAGITDVNNMGAAMAPAAVATLTAHFQDTGFLPSRYDLIVTGDLGKLGKRIVLDQMSRNGYDLQHNYEDCGVLIYSASRQDVHCGGSGCGCSASVLCGHLLDGMRAGRWKRLLFCGTGALHSTLSLQQGGAIPGICHAVALETDAADKGGN